jgi:23S rRNA (adenine2030-N6)-methyltransferase
MLSYRHAFHAGNHADVLKHWLVVRVILALQRKATPLCYIDTHAGAGEYSLDSAEAQQLGEAREGIAKLWDSPHPPPSVETYLAQVRAMNPGPRVVRYPGSPRLAGQLQRPGDRLVLMEKHPTDARALARSFSEHRGCRVVAADGWASLRGFIPPQERRGLVLIDPPYELKSDYRMCVETLTDACRRWATGVYLLWYPLVSRREADRLIDRVRDIGVRRTLQVELAVRAPDTVGGLWGSGMLVLNCPWQVDEDASATLPWLAQMLSGPDAPLPSVRWLVPD